VRDCAIPVFGLYAGELRPVSFEYGGGSDGVRSIAMRYVPPKVPAAEIAAFIETRHGAPLQNEPESKRWELMSHGQTLLSYASHPSQERGEVGIQDLDEVYGEGEPLSLQFPLPDFRTVIAVQWMVPEVLTVVLAENGETQVLVGALGFEHREFARLLPEVRRIDNDTQVLAWHDEVFARRLREILEQ